MNDSGDKTVIVKNSTPKSGAVAAADDPDTATMMRIAISGGYSQHALAPGIKLAEFEVLGLIGEGGFGIVYLAYDTQLRRNVALKEYIPAALASRVGAAEVSVRSRRHEDTFRAGLKSFINEARLLAQFDHHSLVKVFRFWEGNGTAYMVMPFYEGVTLRDTLRSMSPPPDEQWLRNFLRPVIDALSVMHAAQCYHRDIAPDNIMLLKGSGRPLLLDFGAARRVIGDMTQALTVILKPGYAPVEQYAEVPSMKQGPWTDVYALAAVVYFAIQGKTPPPAVGRLMSDTYVPLETAAAGQYSAPFLRAIDHALAVRPGDRPQSIEQFGAELDAPAVADKQAGVDELASANQSAARRVEPNWGSTDTPPKPGPARPSPGRATRKTPAPEVSAASALRPDTAPKFEPTETPPRSPFNLARDNKRLHVSLVVGACLIVGTVVAARYAPRHDARQIPESAGGVVPAATASARPLAASTQVGNADLTTAAVAPPAVPADTVQPAVAPPAATEALDALPPYTPKSELSRIATLADKSIHVTTTLPRTTARINKDRLQFSVTSNRAGYVYVFMTDSSGQLRLLFPNGIDKRNAIGDGQTLALPRSSWPMMAGAPAGPISFLVMVSPSPRDFTNEGLQSGAVFAAFPVEAQRAAARRRTPDSSPFTGDAHCADPESCRNEFGAATFQIDVVS